MEQKQEKIAKERRKIVRVVDPNSDKFYEVIKFCRYENYPGNGEWERQGRRYTTKGLRSFLQGVNGNYEFEIDEKTREHMRQDGLLGFIEGNGKNMSGNSEISDVLRRYVTISRVGEK